MNTVVISTVAYTAAYTADVLGYLIEGYAVHCVILPFGFDLNLLLAKI